MSKFKELFEARRGGPQEKLPPSRTPRRSGPGRPEGSAGGKRSDPAYTQITAYVRRDSLTDVKAKLLKDGQDMSDLIQKTFDEYLGI